MNEAEASVVVRNSELSWPLMLFQSETLSLCDIFLRKGCRHSAWNCVW